VGKATGCAVGHFDGVKGYRALGWVADLDAPEQTLEVEFFKVAPDGQSTHLGRARADRPRVDLQTIGLNNIRHGFDWRIPYSRSGFLLSARLANDAFELPGSPIEIGPVPAEPPRRSIDGHLDGIGGSLASGWIADLDAPGRTLEVEFLRVAPDGQSTSLGRTRANRPRDDLQAIGLDNIHHGFDWRMPFSRNPFVLRARLAGDDFELPGSPVEVTPKPAYEGTFDGITRGVLRGWAWAWDPAISVAVEVFVDGRLRGTAPARIDRPDLVIAHIGHGRHGFAWIVPTDLADGIPHEFACRIAGTSVDLRGSPQRAVITPGDRSFALPPANAVRGFASRPLPPWIGAGASSRAPQSPVGDHQAPPRRSTIAKGTPSGEGQPTLQRPRIPGPGVFECPPSTAANGAKRVRLLVPVWGREYISLFCRIALPSLLSPNNLPYLLRHHELDVVFLTRSDERNLFRSHPAHQLLAKLTSVSFIDIDDILTSYFDRAPGAYATALTYAFFRGIRAMGEAALETDFLFWNADFVPADGVFRTMADLITAGVRCTFAPSLRVDLAVEDALPGSRRSGDGSVLDIGPREWVALAMRFPHPTVRAQTLNRFEERMIDTVNQLYWSVNDEVMVARVFLMFMLHIRPERVWDDVYGHCDYAFVPEMVPSSDYHIETSSDRMLIIELQHHNRESQDIVYGDWAMTPAEIARGVARWTTREHRLTSRQMVVFNASDVATDLEPARRMTDEFMADVYRLMPKDPIWHNGHLFWTDSLASLGLPYEDPGPDHPRSHLAAALRWTGHDIDALRESWPDPAGPPHDIFDLALPLDPSLDIQAWLAQAHSRYLSAWRDATDPSPPDLSEIDLISGHFQGFGWGLVERRAESWARRLSPDGGASLLLRVPSTTGLSVRLDGADLPRNRCAALTVSVNGQRATPRWTGFGSGKPSLHLEIARNTVIRAKGRLEISLSTNMEPNRPADEQPLAFAKLAVRIDQKRISQGTCRLDHTASRKGCARGP
jgi:hypothetical protein